LSILCSIETISLTADQEERARAIYHRADDGDITSATVFIEWVNPSKVIDTEVKEEPLSRHKEYIDPTTSGGRRAQLLSSDRTAENSVSANDQ